MATQPVNSFVVCIVLIIVKIVLQNEQQNNTDRNPKREPKDVKHRKKFVFQKDAYEKFQVGAEHETRVGLTKGLEQRFQQQCRVASSYSASK
jgi:hypothetical protein